MKTKTHQMLWQNCQLMHEWQLLEGWSVAVDNPTKVPFLQ
jgi:hypothetical protein